MLSCIYAHNSLGIGFRELQRMTRQTNYNSYYYCIFKLRKYDVIATTPKDKKIHLTEKGKKFVITGLIPTLLWQIDEHILNDDTTPRVLEKNRNRYDNTRRREDIEKQYRLIRLYTFILSSCALEYSGTSWIEEHDTEQLAKYLDSINAKSIEELEKIGEVRPYNGYTHSTYTCYCNPEFPYIMVEKKEIPILKWSHKYSPESSPGLSESKQGSFHSKVNLNDVADVPLYLKVMDQVEKIYEREAKEVAERISSVNMPAAIVRYRFSVLGVSKESLSLYRYPDSLQSDIAFSQDEIEKALHSLELLHIIKPRLLLPDGQKLYFIVDEYDQMVSFAHDCLSLKYIVTEMIDKLLINRENRCRKNLKNAAVDWFETSLGKRHSDKKLRELYYSLEDTEISNTNCRLNMNESLDLYYHTPKLFKGTHEAIRHIKQKHKNILDEHSYLAEPMLNMAHYEPLLYAVSKISGIGDDKRIKYPLQKSQEKELKSKLYAGMNLKDAYQILAEEDIPSEHHDRVLFCNLRFGIATIDDSYQNFCLANR